MSQFRSQFNKLKAGKEQVRRTHAFVTFNTDHSNNANKGLKQQKERTENMVEANPDDFGAEEEDDNEEITVVPHKKPLKQLAKQFHVAGITNNTEWHPHQIVSLHENKDGIKHCTASHVALTGGHANDNMDGVHAKMFDVKDEIIISKEWPPQ